MHRIAYNFPSGSCYTNSTLGKDYVGQVTKTKTGKTCQKWDSFYPHVPNTEFIVAQNFPENTVSDAGNNCRNPDSDPSGPWCYTTDILTRWEPCDIPLCDTKGKLQ